MLTGEFFNGRAQTPTFVGYDLEWSDTGPADYAFYLADSNFNVVYNLAIPASLGVSFSGRPRMVAWTNSLTF